MAFHEHHTRSIAKALSYRFMILLSDSIIAYAITRRLDITLNFLIFSNLASTLFYFLHERFWNSVAWGKESAAPLTVPSESNSQKAE